MKDYLKFLRKLSKPLRNRLILALELIELNKLKSLDVKSLVGNEELYRCRVGKIRIIFRKTEQGNKIIEIGFRGGVY
jgi:mRNA-degrading endonuclease RelE of RelBE toxin-antitoxin system